MEHSILGNWANPFIIWWVSGLFFTEIPVFNSNSELRHCSNAAEGLMRHCSDAAEGLMRHCSDAAEGLMRHCSDAAEGLMRHCSDAAEGLSEQGLHCFPRPQCMSELILPPFFENHTNFEHIRVSNWKWNVSKICQLNLTFHMDSLYFLCSWQFVNIHFSIEIRMLFCNILHHTV